MVLAEPRRPPETSSCRREGSDPWDLVGKVQRGDTTAFGSLYERYYDDVLRYVRKRLGRSPYAEDLASDTFLRALLNIRSVSYHGNDFLAWLYTIARNLTTDHIRSKHFRTPLIADTRIADRPASDNVESQVIPTQIVGDLRQCLTQLTAAQQECLGLRFWMGYSVAETALRMKRDPRAVRQLQFRALGRLHCSMRETRA